MPITLAKLFSPTATVSFPFLGETVNVTWAPFKYTGEMQELAEKMVAEDETDKAEIAALRTEGDEATAEAARLLAFGEGTPEFLGAAVHQAKAVAAYDALNKRELRLDSRDKQYLRESVSRLVVTWDVLGEDRKPIPTDLATLKTLPDFFIRTVFVSLSNESQTDPLSALESDEPSPTGKISARSRTGTSSSPGRGRSVSPRSSSTNGRTAHATTPAGAPGP